MNAATHIIGGYVFAGTLCSFTDVNVFEKPEYIIACAVFSVLPDIDTTKSAVGKIFYPVSWLLYRKLGHRTITHSLLFLFFVWALLFSLLRFGIVVDANFVKIAVFATLGHFVFDLITVSGIPLLYPFFKNPCVMPGDVNLRFKSGEWKGEIVIFGICGLLCFTMQPLFAHGFWTSYNRQFATVRHVDRENKNTEYYVVCEYEYIMNAETRTGEAIVIDSKQSELTLFDRRNIFTLSTDDPQLKIIYTRPRISTIEKRFEEIHFYAIQYDSLQRILNGKLASGVIQSNVNFSYIENSVTYQTKLLNFDNRFDFRIYAEADTSRTTIRRNIARIEASIKQAQQRHKQEVARYDAHFNSIAALVDSLKSQNLSNYERNRMQRELIRLRNRTIEEPVYNPPTVQIAELAQLKQSLTENNLTFSGHLTVFTFGYDHSRSNPSVAINPINLNICYSGASLLASLNSSNPLY